MGDFFMRVPRPTERPTNPLCLLICHEKSCGTFRNCAIFLGRTHPELRTFTHSSSAVRNGFFFSRRAIPQVSSLVLPPPPRRSACLGSIFHDHLVNGWAVALGCLGPQVCWVFWGFTVVVVSGIYKQKMCEGNKDVCLPKLVKHTVSFKKSRKKAGGASDAFFVPTFEFFPSLAKDPFYPPPFERAVFCVLKRRRGERDFLCAPLPSDQDERGAAALPQQHVYKYTPQQILCTLSPLPFWKI